MPWHTFQLGDGSYAVFKRSYEQMLRDAAGGTLTGSAAFLDDALVEDVHGRKMPLKAIVPPELRD